MKVEWDAVKYNRIMFNLQNVFRNTISQIVMSILEEARILNVSFSTIFSTVQYWNLKKNIWSLFLIFGGSEERYPCYVLPPFPAGEA